MKILVTGAAGLIGQHVAERFAREHEVVALKHADLDITDREAVIRTVSEAKPALIVNCAVVQVDESEQEPAKAQAVNIEGPRALAEAARHVGAEIVHFGTQYAFAGEPIGRAAYTINDELQPVNLYGRTKVAGEAAVRQACARSYIIRTSWVYGKGKKSFLCTVHSDLLAQKRVRAIVDIWSSTTYAVDLVNRISEIISRQRCGTYHVVNEGVCSYYEFALEAGRLVGLSKDQLDSLIDVVKEEAMHRPAARPRYTPMRCLLSEELSLPSMRDWRAALAEYVNA
ncbi:MAG TPA: dTDP-4-dehydrorhamnose reductase [Candidatus Binatia bacterium]|nr:dTDP-4-dehydrorhamnose reductase [Candidatus Binatia bacterium]